jgi:hypothetical protein
MVRAVNNTARPITLVLLDVMAAAVTFLPIHWPTIIWDTHTDTDTDERETTKHAAEMDLDVKIGSAISVLIKEMVFT